MVPKSHHSLTLSPESIGGGVRGAMPLEYLEEDYEAGVDALPQQLRLDLNVHLVCFAKRETGFEMFCLAGLCFKT